MFELHGQTIAGPKRKTTRLYRIWTAMRYRCYGKGCDSYDRYGGRGIKVCDEWNGSFVPFRDWAMENGYTDELTLDRVDNDGNYEPGNCRWTTYQAQSENRKNTRWVEINGVTKTMAQWSYATGIHIATLHRRYHSGVRGEDFIKPCKPVLPTNRRWANRPTSIAAQPTH
jgi:hypothetical protein